MKVSGRGARARLHFDPVERELLSGLLDDLDGVLGGSDDADPGVLARLYPAAYQDDDAAAAEFRSLTEASLSTERAERIEDCRADLDRAAPIDLADDIVARRWLQLLNDLRLTHGTRLGITEDDDHQIDPSDPAQRPKLVYYWLTAVQDSIVRAVTR